MSLYLNKVLALLAMPLGWALLLGSTALLLAIFGRRRAAAWVLAVQLVLLWVFAMPWTAYRLTAWLEAPYPPVALGQTPSADVAIVLGGAVGAVGDPPVENLSGASDRVLRAARLFRGGRVRHVLAVGGNIPWLSGSVPEAEAMRDLLAEWGVPREAVVTETASTSARENALFASEIVRARGWEQFLLVTSAADGTGGWGLSRCRPRCHSLGDGLRCGRASAPGSFGFSPRLACARWHECGLPRGDRHVVLSVAGLAWVT